MKQRTVSTLRAFGSALVGLGVGMVFWSTLWIVVDARVESAAQKRGGVNVVVDLDTNIKPLVGKRVFYQLTDSEGGGGDHNIRKVPAFLAYNYRGENRRDDSGRLVVALVIMRPGFLGGPFTKDEVASDSGRSQGTWDNAQPGDESY